MARGELDEAQLDAIAEKLPDVITLRRRAQMLYPHGLAMVCAAESNFPIAAVCLADAAHTFCEIRYAFHEYHAHHMYYREVVIPPQVPNATFFERYYLDDAAFRLYAAAEDLAEAIIYMLELSEEDVRPYEQGGSSRQATVGRYLFEKQPGHELTKHVRRLIETEGWSKARKYRDLCVHDQPPLVEGPGTVFLRKNRWKVSEDGKSRTYEIDGGDKPELTTKDIYDFVMPAFGALLKAFDGCLTWYEGACREPRGGAWRFASGREVMPDEPQGEEFRR